MPLRRGAIQRKGPRLLSSPLLHTTSVQRFTLAGISPPKLAFVNPSRMIGARNLRTLNGYLHSPYSCFVEIDPQIYIKVICISISELVISARLLLRVPSHCVRIEGAGPSKRLTGEGDRCWFQPSARCRPNMACSAVSTRRVRGPSRAGVAPACLSCSTSKGINPPSGPIINRAGEAGVEG